MKFTTTKEEVRQAEWTATQLGDRVKLLASADKAILNALRSWDELPSATVDALMTIDDWSEVLAGPSEQKQAARAEAQLQRRARTLRESGFVMAAESLDSISRDYRTLADAL